MRNLAEEVTPAKTKALYPLLALDSMNVIGSFVRTLKARPDDDGIDRLSYYYTCLILLILSVTISAKQYVGQPIQCWVPAQFTGAWEQYAENYCFVQNTYWLAISDNIPDEPENRKELQIGYYQWVPFMLAIEASFFYLPCIVWRLLNWQSGIRLAELISLASTQRSLSRCDRSQIVDIISKHIQESIAIQRAFGKSSRHGRFITSFTLAFVKERGFYLTILYLAVKLLYLGNAVGQFFLLNAFLYPKHTLWGVSILQDLIHGIEWEQSGHFPRVTMCDFEVRTIGNLHRYTIQCVLMINMFNEKAFLFLWWWFLVVAIATCFNFVYWTLASISSRQLVYFIAKYTRILGISNSHEDVKRFALKCLQRDGLFILRMLSLHVGDLITAEVIKNIWINTGHKLHIPVHGNEDSRLQMELHRAKVPSND
ncbi:Innexin domain containing protein [Trichuris trichiura]|uniref:Innexin n=1 Tax=Trichuris trichiura TaxID=36087 RepID=A0A077Z654_TRITR|nr:Innexin domain containing protein [Trichuris trichiura]